MLNSKLIVGAALFAVAGLAQAGIPKDIVFDGYCDGLTNLTKNGDGVGGTWANLDCAGASAVVGGPQGNTKAGQKGYIMGSYGLGAVYGLEVTVVVSKDGTWSLYDTTGGVLNSGTWTPGTPGALAGGKAALGR